MYYYVQLALITLLQLEHDYSLTHVHPEYVIASNNVLSGSMSAGMFNAPALLEVLLDINKFTGKIPKGLVTLENTNELCKCIIL